MCKGRGLLRILGKEVRRVEQEIVIAEGIVCEGVFLGWIEAIVEKGAILSILLM